MVNVYVPRENVNDETVVILSVNYDSGAAVNQGDIAVSIETSKTNIDIEVPKSGLLQHALKVGSEIEVGAFLFSIADTHSKEESISIDSAIEVDHSPENFSIKFSNLAIKRAKELNVELNSFKSGWITVYDIEKTAGYVPLSSSKGGTFTQKNDPVEASFNQAYSEVFATKRKQAEIRNLEVVGKHGSTSTIGIKIHLLGSRVVSPPYLFDNSISDLLVFEASRLLKKYPELNATYLDEKRVALYNNINFGWSFDSGKNLKVLTVENAEQLELHELQKVIEDLLNLYESGKQLPINLLTGSTVTFSDLSNTAASFMYPLINGNQSLILGVVKHAADLFEIFASFDHRVAEGLTVINFLTELKERISSYYLYDGIIKSFSCHACNKSISDEIKLGYRGFVKITLPSGKDVNLCRNCYEGE